MGRILTGWDIGGVNIKAARIDDDGQSFRLIDAVVWPFEMWKSPERLADRLRTIAARLGDAETAAITMTAELCDCFPTKRAGVLHVLSAAVEALHDSRLLVLDVQGRWLDPAAASRIPLQVAAANWVATGHLAAWRHPNTVLMDVGSTTTDIVPIVEGNVCACGRTDPERLSCGELIYTGAVRTDLSAVVDRVPLRGRWCNTAAEQFAIAADVYLLLGYLPASEYTCSPPDNGDRTVAAAGRRLARLVCADEEMMTPVEIEHLARFVYHHQATMITDGLLQVLSAMRRRPATVTVTGVGMFLADEASRRAGLQPVDLNRDLDLPPGVPTSAVATAWLLNQHLKGTSPGEAQR